MDRPSLSAQTSFRGASIGSREKAMRNRMVKQVVSLLVLATILSIMQVWSRVQVLDARYAITEVQKRGEQLVKEINQADLIVASMKSVARLSKIAREELGMAPATAEQMRVVQMEEERVTP